MSSGLFFRDLPRWLPNYRLAVVFDVGANIGQTVKLFKTQAPDVRMYSFEPVQETYLELKNAVAGWTDVFCSPIALGAAPGAAHMRAVGTRTTNRIEPASKKTVEVPISTGDLFCADNGVERISYLKVDTEGHDMEVLHGFAGMLAPQKIDFVEVEAGMNPTNTWHVPLQTFREYLEPLGYMIFQLYDQVMESKGRPVLRRCNPVFIAGDLVAQHWTPPAR